MGTIPYSPFLYQSACLGLNQSSGIPTYRIAVDLFGNRDRELQNTENQKVSLCEYFLQGVNLPTEKIKTVLISKIPKISRYHYVGAIEETEPTLNIFCEKVNLFELKIYIESSKIPRCTIMW